MVIWGANLRSWVSKTIHLNELGRKVLFSTGFCLLVVPFLTRVTVPRSQKLDFVQIHLYSLTLNEFSEFFPPHPPKIPLMIPFHFS